MEIADPAGARSETSSMRLVEDQLHGEGHSSRVPDEDFDDPPVTPQFSDNHHHHDDNQGETNNNDQKGEGCGGRREEDVDIEELLARPRHRVGLFRRQNNSLNKARSTLDAPEFVKRLNAFEEAKAGGTVVFGCRFQAFPRPTIRWYRDDEEVSDDNNRVCREEKENGEVRLIINNCRKSDEAAYKCKAENTEGVASTTGYLSVTGDIKEKSLAAQPRKNAQHAVSIPPRLKCLVEQKSLELREEEECSFLPPSPIHEYVASLKKKMIITTAKQKSPSIPRLEDIKKEEEDAYDSGSDTSVESQDFDRIPTLSDSDDVFDRDSTPEPDVILGSEVKQQNGDLDVAVSLTNERKAERLRSPGASHNGVAAAPSPALKQGKKNTAKIIYALTARADMKIVNSFAFAKIQQGPVLYGALIQTTPKAEIPDTTTIPKGPVLYGPKPDVPIHDNRRSDTTTTTHSSSEIITHATPEFPWLFALAFSSIGTLIATATEMSPVMFVILLAIISLLSFRILLSTKLQCTP